ncbi:pyridoxal 5'-phosphate synthase glutaminase subunit PdxT [Caviibacter abscessus]|uniref:pyridoxal 5'-phosphate synthase glutaminase subunit PdxT n=1 Tax=Caviibacter abscessus TaxID=1766719 RepID=UPI00082DE8FB|nr:pyridoxal 5'-phosphate synthase glutaminase subunit PdxT [Caviibacter abscessus]
MVIGVLALQGAFIEHEQILNKLGVDYFEIRKKSDMQKHMDGIILPGGESTAIGKLLRDLDIYDELKSKIEKGLPAFGTCAGMILLAKKILNDDKVHLAVMDIEVKRNAYGRQLGSFVTRDKFEDVGIVPMVFIRAPYIEKIGENVKIMSTVNGNIVAARQNNILVTSYHPELSDDTSVHKYFIEMIGENK